ncbi:hypothetical protein MPTK1_5g08740 [Marchantia polymorpha subsp. ruderalis]|nr:hypothetical protein MARPO_0086s0087 [Marchantia polymorpha]BBN11065.1 hypothetical protein Mp_5g08740 [Marchantia polymorpha subsp. ruderalis]|eukprot:PTQ33775.1 hypothetical protein MARPO_0086s0087 [Marchantia polymorpha]
MAPSSRKSPPGPQAAAGAQQQNADRAVENFKAQYDRQAPEIPPEVPRFFNLQIGDWNMNQYGSMIPEAEKARRLRLGETLGSTLPYQFYDIDSLNAEIQPQMMEYNLKNMMSDQSNLQLCDREEEYEANSEADRKTRLQEAQRAVLAAEASEEAARKAIEEKIQALALKAELQEKQRAALEAEFLAARNSPVPQWSPNESPQEYRRRVQFRRWRNQMQRLRLQSTPSAPFHVPAPPPPEPDSYQPRPPGLYHLIEPTGERQAAAAAAAAASPPSSGDSTQSLETQSGTRTTMCMEHHPQPAETHYFDPEACTRRKTQPWKGDPFPTVHPYLGKLNESGPKYANWSPHPHLCDMETLSKRFGSWRGSQALEIEPQVNAGNLSGERLRLGWGAEYGNVRYPPVGLCNEQQLVPTEHPGHVCRVDYRQEPWPCEPKCAAGITLSSCNPSWPTTSRPGMPWYTMQGLRPESQPHPFTLQADMRPAGLSTENNVSLSYRNHPRNVLDPSLKNIVLSKTLGQFTGPKFGPRPGDIMIVQQPRCRGNRDQGYVAFCSHKSSKHKWMPGDQIVRVGKFVDGRWTLHGHLKMFKLIDACSFRWMIIGLVERDRWFCRIPKPCTQKIASGVLGFWPRRGDLLLKALSMNDPSQLDWVVVPGTGPAFKPNQGDVILRASIDCLQSGDMAGSVEMYVFDGLGVGWVFMGRDDCRINSSGQDTLT